MRALIARLGDERGYSVVELLAVTVILPIVIGGALTTFTNFNQSVSRNQRLNESQARTREALDQLARDLRNLASPTPEQPLAIDKAHKWDLVFQTVDASGPGTGGNPANIKRVRYCLDKENQTAVAALWVQTQTWTTAVPPPLPTGGQCPDSSWPGSPRQLATGVTNRLHSDNYPLFQFNAPTDTPSKITAVVAQLWVRAPGSEVDPSNALGLLRTQVDLRNQNDPPVCAPQATADGTLQVLLNGAASYDPEGQDLTYDWFDTTENRSLGTGAVVRATVNTSGSHTIRLTAKDPAGLQCTADLSVFVVA
jgi:type II secretory pathway pseudopilin PulG